MAGEDTVVCARVMSEVGILNLVVLVLVAGGSRRRGEVEARRRELYKRRPKMTTGRESTRDDLIVV